MKKFVILLIAFGFLNVPVLAHSHHHNRYNHPYYNNSSHSESVYLTHSEYKVVNQKFQDCDEHYLEIETTTNSYSDGTRRVFYNMTVYNADGSVLIDNCRNVEHTLYNNIHYFIVRQQRGGYRIIDGKGNITTNRDYSYLEELEPNRIMAKYDKRYGVIDLNEKTIIPIKYQKFQKYGDRNFISKLNGYWGLVDIDNTELIKHDCDKITPLYDTLIIKRYKKYGLANRNGYIFLEPVYDNIKKYKEYILIKKDDKYGLLDFEGKKISEIVYKKIKLDHNTVKGQFNSGKWVVIR